MVKAVFIFTLVLSALLTYSQGDSTNTRGTNTPKYEKAKGYNGWVEVAVNFLPLQREHSNTFPSPELLVFNGARLNKNITLGLELGLHAYTHFSINPKLRYTLYLKSRVGLIFDFGAGYTYTFINWSNGHGFNFSPSIGFKVWGKKGKAAFTFRTGYTGIITREVLIAPHSYPTGLWKYYSGVYANVGIEF